MNSNFKVTYKGRKQKQQTPEQKRAGKQLAASFGYGLTPSTARTNWLKTPDINDNQPRHVYEANAKAALSSNKLSEGHSHLTNAINDRLSHQSYEEMDSGHKGAVDLLRARRNSIVQNWKNAGLDESGN